MVVVDRVIPPYDREAAVDYAENGAEETLRRISSNVGLCGLDRLEGVSKDDRCLILFGHTAMKDYPLSQYALIKAGLPPTRVVGGMNLDNWLFRAMFGLDFSKFGMYWHDKGCNLRDFERDNFSIIRKLLERGESLAEFPEGTRNRHPENGPLIFKKGFIRGFLAAQDELGFDGKLICAAMYHEKIPERQFYWLTDGGRKGDLRYYLGDLFAYLNGRLMTDKGASYINFGFPKSLRKVAEEGDLKRRASRVSEFSREEVRRLYEEVSSDSE